MTSASNSDEGPGPGPTKRKPVSTPSLSSRALSTRGRKAAKAIIDTIGSGQPVLSAAD
jgi:hypothetical protein